MRYTKVDKLFTSKRAANTFIKKMQANGTKFDRTYVRETSKGFIVMYLTFPAELKRKIQAIEKMSLRTGNVLDYNQIAAKPIAWINKKFESLTKQTKPYSL
jgi:hypothetical protein